MTRSVILWRDPDHRHALYLHFYRRVGQGRRAAAPLAWVCGGAWGKGWMGTRSANPILKHSFDL